MTLRYSSSMHLELWYFVKRRSEEVNCVLCPSCHKHQLMLAILLQAIKLAHMCQSSGGYAWLLLAQQP